MNHTMVGSGPTADGAPTHVPVLAQKDTRLLLESTVPLRGAPELRASGNRRKSLLRPETLRQAQTWDKNKRHYLALGLCSVCAAQASWGHQQGFREIKPPCAGCLHVVMGFPVNEPGEWRSDSPRRSAPLSTLLTVTRSSVATR